MAETTVIIPVFNCKKYVEEAVDSVLSQPSGGINIVLVDDGSTDGSGALCDQLSARYERVTVIHKKNGGVSSARNAGIEYALSRTDDSCKRNSFLVFLDADDIWVENFFNAEVDSILQEDYDVVGFQHSESDSTLSCLTLINNLHGDRIVSGGENSIWAHGNRHLGCMFFRMELLAHYGIRFPDGLNYNEDEIFKVYTECLCRKMYFCGRLMYIYRLHGASAVHNLEKNIPRRYQTWMAAWRKMDDDLFLNYGVKIDFGKMYAAAYFLEMCIVYTQSIITYKSLRMLVNSYCDGDVITYMSGEKCPLRLRNDWKLLHKNFAGFYIKHSIIGLLRKSKHWLLAKVKTS